MKYTERKMFNDYNGEIIMVTSSIFKVIKYYYNINSNIYINLKKYIIGIENDYKL